jgi:hypothetical protein
MPQEVAVVETRMSVPEFKKSLGMMSVVFPNRRIESGVYYELLKDLDSDAVFNAVIAICKESQLYPDSNLIAMIRDIAQPKSKYAVKPGTWIKK